MRHLHHGFSNESRRVFMMNCARAAFGVSVGSVIPGELLAATPTPAAAKPGSGKNG